MSHNLLIILASMAIQLPLALIIALVLNRKFPGRSIVRVIIFAPYVISEVIAGVMWFIIFDPTASPPSSWNPSDFMRR